MAQENCPQCGGTGWKVMEAEDSTRAAVRCDCGVSEHAARILEHARIPLRYRGCDLENFDLGLYDAEPEAAVWNRSLEQAKLVTQAFARHFPVGAEHGLLLMGPSGVGKTHLAVAALKEILERGHEGLFYDYREVLKEIQASYNPESQSTEMDVLEPVLSVPLLVLDDLGASKPSAWALETVGHILNTRYNEKRVTLVTTNYLDNPAMGQSGALAPMGSGLPSARLPSGQPVPIRREDTLADRVGQRIRSRLLEMCRTVDIVAPDYRERFRQAGRLRP